jgi:cell division protease FtsH
MNKSLRFNLGYILLAVLGVFLIRDLWTQQTQVQQLAYSDYLALLKAGRLEEVSVGSTQIQGTLKDPGPGEKKQFVTTRIDPEIAPDFVGTSTKVRGLIESSLLYDLLAWTVPAIVFVGIWFLLLKRLGGRGGLGGEFMSVGKSKAKVYMQTDSKVSFEDVAGVDEAKQELQEIVNFLKNPSEYARLGGRMPKGILLVGPPGTGKTLLASISGSEFVEMFVGVGAARVRDLFEQARGKAPAIIFIDELDALGKSRAAGPMAGGHDEKEQTLNQLLVELDGFDTQSGLILLAATNRPEILDPALLRAGRFDRQVLVDRPDRKGRIDILKVHMHKLKALDDSVDAESIAALTPGFTGADLANLTNEAALIATRRQAAAISMNDFNEAIERIIAGLEKKNRILNPVERQIVAYHEMGHALVGAALSTTDRVHKVSIIPRGIGALGYTIQRPTEDRFLMTRAELENKIAVLLAGRAAESLIFQHWSTGAADDLAKATDIAWNMVTRYGMDEKLGHVSYDSETPGYLTSFPAYGKGQSHGVETAQSIDQAIKDILDQAFDRAIQLLSRSRPILEDSAQLLLTQETLNKADLDVFFSRLKEQEQKGQAWNVNG